MGTAASASSVLAQDRQCPPLVPTPPMHFAPYQPMVRYDKCTKTAFLSTSTMRKRMATDEEMTMMQWWEQGGLDDVETPTLPFCGWPYWRRLIWGCCYTDADVLSRVAQPQLVDNSQLFSYPPPPTEMMVWVNFASFGTARVVGFTSLRAGTQQLLYFVVQKLQPFGAIQGDPWGAGYFYRVPAMWCARMPAAVVSIFADIGEARVWIITRPPNDKIVSVGIADLQNPENHRYEAELRIARQFLMRDWPRYALALFPRTAPHERYMPTDKDLRRWYGYLPRPRRRPAKTAEGDGDDEDDDGDDDGGDTFVSTTTSQSSSSSSLSPSLPATTGRGGRQQQSSSSSSVNVIRVGVPLSMDAGAPLCAFVNSSSSSSNNNNM